MSTLVTLPRSSLAGLSVGTLKQILFEARVRVPPGIVEKEELVERAWTLIEEERRKDNEGIDDVGSAMEDGMESAEEPDREEEVVLEGNPFARPRTPQPSTPRPNLSTPKATSAESSGGLCVICQDDEATIAVVDCGYVHILFHYVFTDWIPCSHLAMCRECSDLVLAGSRECPLCRTRIVTEARLLRIFKT